MSSSTRITPRNVIRPVVGAGIVLLVPLVVMQYSDDLHWTLFDFGVAAVLLLAVGFACEVIMKHTRSKERRVIAFAAVFLVLALVWIELAVGLFGTPFAGN